VLKLVVVAHRHAERKAIDDHDVGGPVGEQFVDRRRVVKDAGEVRVRSVSAVICVR
jgi:hypothetical protein